MARHVVRLKLALLGGTWRKGVGYGFLQAFGILMALSTATFGVLLAVVAVRIGDLRVVVASVAALLWTVGPLVGVGLDETLDPAKLELLPLERRQLVAGLALASAVGPGGIATFIPLLAFGVLGVPGPLTALAGAVAAVAQLGVCVLLARCVATSVARLLRTRRGRDVLALLGGLFGLAIAGAGQLPRLAVEAQIDLAGVRAAVDAVAGAFRWLPTSWSMATVDAVGDGRWPAALAFAGGTGLFVMALQRWWARLLRNTLERPTDAPPMRTRSTPLLGGFARWLPHGPTAAAAARDLRYAVAAPQRRISTLLLGLTAAVPVIVVALSAGLQRPLAMLFGLAPVVLTLLVVLNLFQVDGLAMWQVLVVPGGARAELRGKVLAQGAVALPLVVASGTAIAALTGAYEWLPLLVVSALAVLLVGAGVGQVASVLVPLPQPDSPTNAFATGSGAGCLQGLAVTLALLVEFLALLPLVVGIGVALTGGPAWQWLAAVLGLAYATGVQVIGHRIAVRLLENGPDDFLARVEAASP